MLVLPPEQDKDGSRLWDHEDGQSEDADENEHGKARYESKDDLHCYSLSTLYYVN